jgi:hypothetical protein
MLPDTSWWRVPKAFVVQYPDLSDVSRWDDEIKRVRDHNARLREFFRKVEAGERAEWVP